MVAAALGALAHVGPHGAGEGHGVMAVLTIAILLGGWVLVGVAAWFFLRHSRGQKEDDGERPPVEAPADEDPQDGRPANRETRTPASHR